MKKIDFESLDKYSNLPNLITSSSNDEIKFKTQKQIIREFNDEKWAAVIKLIEKRPNIKVQDVDRIMEDFEKEYIFFFDENFYLGSGKERFDLQMKIYEDTLKKYVEGASCLVEIGAGYGSKILNLARNNEFSKLPLYAFEYTHNGCKAIECLSKNIGKNIKVGLCDLKSSGSDDIKLPKDAIIFTSFCLHYISDISFQIIQFLLKFKPKIVVNFEPCYESHSNTKFGKMCRRYIELNDYNKNIKTRLIEARNSKSIYLKTTDNIFGGNPFLPMSIFEWKSI